MRPSRRNMQRWRLLVIAEIVKKSMTPKRKRPAGSRTKERCYQGGNRVAGEMERRSGA